jgi:twinkle protein
MKVGLVFLEQSPTETVVRLAGKLSERILHIPDEPVPHEERRAALERLRGRALIYDSWGHAEWETVDTQIRYMLHAQGIQVFYLDHLTALADPKNERESMEELMQAMATLAHELGIIIHYISHLTTPDTGSHEEGARVTIRSFKGSRSIGFWSHFMFGMERDQQAENDDDKRITTFRVLKDRFTGRSVGATFLLDYNTRTGMLIHAKPKEDTDDYGFKEDPDF